jgi:hypothetical protein
MAILGDEELAWQRRALVARRGVEEVAENNAATEDTPFFDCAANADDTVGDLFGFDKRSLADVGIADMRVSDKRARQVLRSREDRVLLIVHVDAPLLARESEVGIVKRTDGADVFPIAFEDIGNCLAFFDLFGDEVPAKIISRFFEEIEEGLALKDVDAHGSQIMRRLGTAMGMLF